MPNDRPNKPHPRAAVSGRMSAEQFRAMMGRPAASPRDSHRTCSSAKPIASPAKAVSADTCIEAVLPFLPPSVNSTYVSVIDRNTGRMKRVLSERARKARKAIQAFVRGNLDPTAIYNLHIDVELPAVTKAGNLRKVDLSNRVKFLEDCIASALGIDDSQFFRITLTKYHAEHERTVIRIIPFNQEERNAA